jgi:hypothetical protein
MEMDSLKVISKRAFQSFIIISSLPCRLCASRLTTSRPRANFKKRTLLRGRMLALNASSVTEDVAKSIRSLCSHPVIKGVFALRSNFPLIHSADHFFEHVEEYAKSDFRPSKQDLLRCRLRPTRVLNRSFNFEDFKFRIIGQKNERRKSIHCFEDVTAIIFVASLSDYDRILYEDNSRTRLTESFDLFQVAQDNAYHPITE